MDPELTYNCHSNANGDVAIASAPHRRPHLSCPTSVLVALLDERVSSLFAQCYFLIAFDHSVKILDHLVLQLGQFVEQERGLI